MVQKSRFDSLVSEIKVSLASLGDSRIVVYGFVRAIGLQIFVGLGQCAIYVFNIIVYLIDFNAFHLHDNFVKSCIILFNVA